MRIIGYCFALSLAAAFTWGPAQAYTVDTCIATCGGFSYPGSTPPLGNDTVEACVGSCSAYQFVPEGSSDASTAACVVVYTNCFVDQAACEATCRSR